MNNTLVLSTLFEPLYQVPWQQAMSDWVGGRVEILEVYPHEQVRTVDETYQMPAVVRFLKDVRKRYHKRPKFSRDSIYTRDGGKCQYCGKSIPRSKFTYDHVFPRSRGGKTTWTNVVTSCSKCNHKKRDRTPTEASMKLLCKPHMPDKIRVGDAITAGRGTHPEEWKKYLGVV